MDEFSFIEKYLSPLAFGKAEAVSLKDDAAIIPQKPGYDIVITKDAIAEGTHFFKNDSPYNIAKKLLRVNISDLAAKGAIPYCCFLALVLPRNLDEEWLAEFTASLKDDLQEFGCFLAGGDTTSHDGGLVLTLTALGHVPTGKAILRSGAAVGDLIFATGTIGDSHLGLQLILGKYTDLSIASKEFLINRYNIPQPRTGIGTELLNIASSATDISDGLLADLQNICNCSKLSAALPLKSIPFSKAAKEAIKLHPELQLSALSGGDDYELLFTAPPSMQDKILEISQKSDIHITKIGEIRSGSGIRLLDKAGREITVDKKGYRHFF